MKEIDTLEQGFKLTTKEGNFPGMTHKGLLRPCNEDRYLIKPLGGDAVMLAVADGLGNGCAGGHAAEMIIDALSHIIQIDNGRELNELMQLVRDLDRAVCEKESTDQCYEGMGSTLVCAVLKNDRVYWVHAGDSRLFILRTGKLIQITEDQTLARFLIKEGEITAQQEPNHYSRMVMDQYVGCGFCEPETGQLVLETGDVLLLSSDGLHDQISKEVLCTVLQAATDPETTVKKLVDAALDAGGPDNITAVVANGPRRKSGE